MSIFYLCARQRSFLWRYCREARNRSITVWRTLVRWGGWSCLFWWSINYFYIYNNNKIFNTHKARYSRGYLITIGIFNNNFLGSVSFKVSSSCLCKIKLSHRKSYHLSGYLQVPVTEVGGVTMDKFTTLICVATLLRMINIDTESLSGNVCGNIGHRVWPLIVCRQLCSPYHYPLPIAYRPQRLGLVIH